jgi:hypothetical protein
VGGVPASPGRVVHPQRSESESEVRGHSQKNLEKEISNAGAQKLPTLARYDFLVEQVRQFHAAPMVRELEAADPAEYAREFELRIGYTPAEFDALREQMADVRRPRVSAYVLRMPKRKPRKRTAPSAQLELGARAVEVS